MKGRRFSLAILSAVLLVLAAGPGLAHDAQPGVSTDAAGGRAHPAGYTQWTIEPVVSSLAQISHVSMAISSYSGDIYISYYEYGDLKMAKYVGSGGNCGPSGNWSCETVDSVGDVGQYSSIAIDPTIDLPAISYYDATNEALKLAQLGNGWRIRSIDGDEPNTSVGTHTSLKIDASGVPHIAYHAEKRDLQSNRLFYATLYSGATSRCTNGDFQCVPIDTAYPGYTSLDLNSHGHIGIAYQLNKRLKYARFVPSPNKGNCGLGMKAWTCTYLQYPNAPDACATSYASLDHDDGPHGAHIASYCGFLHYARYVGTGGNCASPSWQCDEIDGMGEIPHTRDVSLVVDNAGFPIIAYHIYRQAIQITVASLNIARPAAALGLASGNCGPQNSWQCDRIPDIGHPGDYLAIAVAPSGLATVAYSNSAKFGSSLRVAYQRPQVFLPLVVKNQ